MRCPSCATENTQDSRFCGGCGAKLGGLLAPTQKLSDDTPYPAPPPRAEATPPPRASTTPPTRSPSIAPTRSASIPPTRSASIAPRLPAPASSPSLPVSQQPNRRGAVIAIVLLADLGLAAAGGVLLAKGLAKPSPAPSSDASPIEPPKVEAAPPIPAAAGAPAAALVQAPTAGSDAQAGPPPPADTVMAARKDDKLAKHHDKPPAKARPGPVDPYAATNLDAEVDQHTTRSRSAFAQCYAAATRDGAVHGTIDIAFQVLPDGKVAHEDAVDNTTGSAELASCLANVIAGWSFAPHAGQPAEFVRPFTYP